MKNSMKKTLDAKNKIIGGPHQYTFTDLIQAAMDKTYHAFIDHPCDEGIEIMNHLMRLKVILNRRNYGK